MLNGVDAKRVYREFVACETAYKGQTGRAGFVSLVRDQLGLTRDRYGRPRVNNPHFTPEEFNLRELAESICGADWVSSLNPSNHGGYQVLEAGGTGANAAISPGMLPDVSAFIGSVTGLLEAKILAAYQTPEFILDQLFQTVPTRTRTTKLIGVGFIGDKAQYRNPGDPFPRAQFEERYTVTPETQNSALAIDVTFEAVFYDQTSQVMQQAGSLGHWLGLRKELEGFKVFTGVTSPYNYRGTSYQTYLTTGNWVNNVTGNELVDWTNINVVKAMFSRMTDQETGNRILAVPDTMVVSPAKEQTAGYIKRASTVELLTGSTSDVPAGTNRAVAANEAAAGMNIISSPLLDQVLTTYGAYNNGSLTGALAQADADKYWWMLRAKGDQSAFAYMENWALVSKTAPADSYTALNQKLVFSMFSDQMGVAAVRDPRYAIQSSG